jgi:hypothetical protein
VVSVFLEGRTWIVVESAVEVKVRTFFFFFFENMAATGDGAPNYI